MRYSFAAGAIFAASVGSVAGQGTCAESQLLGGNWYCSLIESIIYNGFPTSGTYKGVKSMGEDGQCEFGEMNFDGPLGVFGEELSVHLRGPAQLKKLAVYSAGDGGNKKRGEPAHAHVHAHARVHARDHARRFTEPEPVTVSAVIDGQPTSWEQDSIPTQPPSKREAAPVEVTATIFGQVVSWIQDAPQPTPAAPVAANLPAGPAAIANLPAGPAGDDSTAGPATGDSSTGSADSAGTASVEQHDATSSPAEPQQKQQSPPSSPKIPSKAKSGSWGRVAYYDASSGTADGLVFLNHQGGQGSGVWDAANGNSLSYASKDAKSGASSPQVLND
ncbi:target of Sbf, partial [Ascosphaera aggregata]